MGVVDCYRNRLLAELVSPSVLGPGIRRTLPMGVLTVVVSTQREDSPRTYVHIESNLYHFREGGFMIYQPSTDLNLINIRLRSSSRIGRIEQMN